MSDLTDHQLAAKLEAVKYNDSVEGKDKRGILFGLTRQERDQIVRALRREDANV